MAEEGKVGEASIDIIANIVVGEESLAAAQAQIEGKLGKDASPRSEKRGGAKQTVDVDAKVKTVGNISKDIQAAIDKDEYQLTIDTASIRRQIEVALQKPFEIHLAAQVAGVGAQHGAAVISGAPMGRGAPPDDVRSAMWHQGKKGGREQYAFVEAIDNVYRNINEALASAGKSRVGTHSLESGNQAEKLAELMDKFGNKVSGWVEQAGPLGLATGKGSMMEAIKEAGLGEKDPHVLALQSNIGGFGGDNKRAAEVFAKRVYDWAQAAPMRAAPAAEQQPQVQQRPSRAAPDPAIMQLIQAQEAASEETRKAVTEERQKSLSFTPVGAETFVPFAGPRKTARGRGAGGPLSVDPEAEARAQAQLGGGERANPRRLRGRGGMLGGIDLEPFLRAAESGQFQDVFERFTSGKQGVSQGLFRAEAGTPEAFDELGRLGKRRPGVKFSMAGQEGRFAAVKPSDALERAFIEATGAPDAAHGFLDENREAVRKATARGARPLVGVKGETKRGQGGVGMMAGGDPAKRLQKFDEWIEYVDSQTQFLEGKLIRINTAIERASKGRDTGKVQQLEQASREVATRIQQLDSGMADAMKDRAELVASVADPQGRRLSQGEQAIASRARQELIERGRNEPMPGEKEDVGVGRTHAERREVYRQSPEAQGAIGAQLLTTMGLGDAERGVSPTEMIRSALTQRYLADQSRVGPTGESRTGKQTMRQAAFGPTGRARRNINEGEDAGVYGELVGAIPGDLSKTSKATLSRAIYDILSATLEDDTFKRDTAETAIKAKEGLTRGVLPGRTTASAIVGEGRINPKTGEWEAWESGTGRVAFDRPRTGEGEFLDAPGLAGRRESTLARMRAMKASGERPPEGSEYPYFDPDTDPGRASIENLLREREAKDRTRQRTLGRGRVQSGDEAMAAARAAGIPMEGEPGPTGLPFTAFSEKYGGGGGGAGRGRGAAGGGSGDWSGLMGGGAGGAIPVYVTGGHLDSMGGGSGGGGGGRGRGRVAAAGEPEPEKETYKVATLPADRKVGAVERAMEQDFVKALRGQNDPRAKAAYEKRQYDRDVQYLAGGSPTPAEAGFLSALGQASTQSGQAAEGRRQRAQEAELKRQRRVARVNDPIGFAAERDIADTGLSDIRGENRAIQRRVPRRGFGASITDLVTSVVSNATGGALEKQLEAADRAQRELNEINAAAEKRSGFITQRRGALQQARELPVGSERRLGLLDQARELKTAAAAQTSIIKASTKIFDENSKIVKENTKAAFGAAAVGSVVSTAIGAFTFGLGSVVAAPIIQGIGTVFQSGLEKLLGDPGLKSATRTALGEGTRGAAGRADIGVAQLAAQAGLSGESLTRLGPELERTAAIEAGNKALEQQIGILKLAEETQARGGNAGVTQTLGGLFGTAIGGTMPAAEQLGNYLGGVGAPGGGVTRQVAGESQMQYLGRAGGTVTTPTADRLVGDIDAFRNRLAGVNEMLGKATGAGVRFTDGMNFTVGQLRAQAQELEAQGAPQLAALVRGGTVGITGQGGGLASGKDALAGITDALIQASKPTVQALLAQTKDERLAQVQLEDAQRNLALNTVQPQTTAIGLAQQGFGVGGPQTAAAGINLSGLSSSDQKRLNGELGQTQKLYDQINRDVDTGIKAAKSFVAEAFSYDPQVGVDFAKSLDAASGYAKEIASIQIGVQTKQAAFSAAQFAYQINIAKRSLADAKGLAGELTGESKNNLGVLEREQFFLQRRAQMLQLELSQRQINFQRSVAGFTAPGLTGEERAARIQQAKIEADYAQKQLNIQKQLFGLGGKQFTIQASRQVQDLVGQLGLLEKGRVLNIETAVAEKRIRILTVLQEKENKKVQTYYEAAIARTNDILTLEAQLVAATGEALVKVTNQVIDAFRRTYAGITDVLQGSKNVTIDPNTGQKTTRHALGAVGTASGATALGPYGTMGEAGGEAYAILRDPQKLMTPLSAGGSSSTIQIIVSGNKFTSEDDEDRVMRKITQAVKDAQDRDFALRGLRN